MEEITEHINFVQQVIDNTIRHNQHCYLQSKHALNVSIALFVDGCIQHPSDFVDRLYNAFMTFKQLSPLYYILGPEKKIAFWKKNIWIRLSRKEFLRTFHKY